MSKKRGHPEGNIHRNFHSALVNAKLQDVTISLVSGYILL